MKKPNNVLLGIFVFSLMLAACSGTAPGESDGEVMEFTEEEVQEAEPAQDEAGMDFSEEEVQGPDEESMDFAEEEVREPAEDQEGFDFTLPPSGSPWTITHDAGTVDCKNGITQQVRAAAPETITFNVGVDGAGLEASGLDGREYLFFVQYYSGPGGTHYIGEEVVDGFPVRYDLYFYTEGAGPEADYLAGFISGEFEGCTVTTSFYGRPAE